MIFSDEFREKLRKAIERQPENARDHLAFNSLVDNEARAEFRTLWQEVRDKSEESRVESQQTPPTKKKAAKKKTQPNQS